MAKVGSNGVHEVAQANFQRDYNWELKFCILIQLSASEIVRYSFQRMGSYEVLLGRKGPRLNISSWLDPNCVGKP